MAALGKEIILRAPAADRFSDQFLTGDVTLGGVDYVESGIECAIQQFADGR